MKTVIGFVCGIVGMVLAVGMFLLGAVSGIAVKLVNEEDKTLKTKPKYSYADWAKQQQKED